MARYRRDYAPGTVQHIIARFVNGAFRLDAPGARQEYLVRLGIALQGTDWNIFGYGLMSSHTHLVGLAGADPLERLVRSVHSGMAGWINHAADTFGPVFAGRPTTVIAAPVHAARLLAYVHNNPIRAALVTSAADSGWTSHRAYLGETQPPEWLDVRLGLEIAGFDTSREGRRAFAESVAARAGDPRDPAIAGDDAGARVSVRASLDAPVEVGAPLWPSDYASPRLRCVNALVGTPLRPSPPRRLDALLELAAMRCGVPVRRLRMRDRTARTVRARRVFLHAAIDALGCSINASAAWVGLTGQGASQLLRGSAGRCPIVQADALWIAQALLARIDPGPLDPIAR